MPLQKEDLKGRYYYWNSRNESALSGPPSRRSFDRYNGDQMLFLINFYGARIEGFTSEEGQAIEQKILLELPDNIKSEVSVFNWLWIQALSS